MEEFPLLLLHKAKVGIEKQVQSSDPSMQQGKISLQLTLFRTATPMTSKANNENFQAGREITHNRSNFTFCCYQIILGAGLITGFDHFRETSFN